MKTIPLGKTGTRVSELCLGTMYFGTKVDEATSRKLMDRYVERGGTFLDTANAYARWIEGFQGGESESLIGRWLKDVKLSEDQLERLSTAGNSYATLPTKQRIISKGAKQG